MLAELSMPEVAGQIKHGALRVWWVAEAPGPSFEYPVESLANAKLLLDVLTAYDTHLEQSGYLDSDKINAGGLQVYYSTEAAGHSGVDEWVDWTTVDGRGIDDVSMAEILKNPPVWEGDAARIAAMRRRCRR